MVAPTCLINSNVDFVINLVVHSLFLFAFLTAFYFLYGSKVAENGFKNNIHNVIVKQSQRFKGYSSTLENVPLDRLESYYSSHPDEYVTEHNMWVRYLAYGIIALFVVVLFLISYILHSVCGICINFKTIILENVIVFACIGIIEYLFFTRVAQKYSPSSATITRGFLAQIQQELE